jgi:ankyrin repeat protein
MTNNDNECFFLDAVEAGNELKVHHLLRDSSIKLDINCRNGRGDTPLILASRNRHSGLVQFLLSEGADPNAFNLDGDTALIVAAGHRGNSAVLRMLISAGGKIDDRNKMGRTALIEAASIGDIENVTFLLQYSPDLDVVTEEAETALTFAVVNEYLEVTEALLRAGANARWTDAKGWSALTYANQSGNKKIINLLEEDRQK